MATQGNFFAATGINASTGSAAQLRNNAFGQSRILSDKTKAKRALLDATVLNQRRRNRLARAKNNFDAATGVAETLLKFK